MLSSLDHWLEDRTGYKRFFHETLFQRIPGGARWRYCWGTTLMLAFFTQLITGVFLWMHYSPSTQTAWESVYYIQHEMTGGWLLRGIHHYMASAMIVLLALHLMQVVIHGAYRAPREITFWLGLLLMLIVLALGLTGYLLPWDQRGFRATQVATGIAGATPLIGDQVKALAVGGSQYGHHTLTRFFALHAGVLPGILIALLVAHVAMFRRYGVTAPKTSTKPDARYWPDQMLRDGVAFLMVLVTVTLVATYMGTELGPPADASQSFNSARPEWYFLFLFQLLKMVEVVAPGEAGTRLGAHIIPGLVLAVMALMPIVGRWKLGHRFNIGFVFAIFIAILGLSAKALHEDYNGDTKASREFLEAKELAHAESERAYEIAHQGIAPSGILPMIRTDTKIAGYRLFERHCATCHAHYDVSGEFTDPLATIRPATWSAPNLFGVGSRAWNANILDHEKFTSDQMFGYKDSPFTTGEMAEWLADNLSEPDEETKLNVANTVAALASMADLPYEAKRNAEATKEIESGSEAISDTFSCVDCHNYEGREFARVVDDDYYYEAPDLTGYMSREWLLAFIRNPGASQFYGERNDRMPAFAPHDDQSLNNVTDAELETIVDWLRRDWSLE